MIWSLPVKGWHYAKKFNYYQKVVGNAIVYIQPMCGYENFIVQLYPKPLSAVCTLEQRVIGSEKAFRVGHEWLERYQECNAQELEQSFFHVYTGGAWLRSSCRGYDEEDYAKF